MKWSKNTEIRSALAQSTIQKWNVLQGKSEEEITQNNHLNALTSFIDELGECRDPNLIPALLPYLEWDARHTAEDKIELVMLEDKIGSSIEDFILPPTFRVRDEALYAILSIQYGDIKLGLVDLGYRDLVPKRDGGTFLIEEEDRWRNSIIQKIINSTK